MDAMPAFGIRLLGVSKAFGRQIALHRVDLDIDPGSSVAVMGANGAGKTTLLRVIAGLARPTRGRVSIAGVDMRNAGPRLRRMVGVVGHETMLYLDLTARENLLFQAKLFGLERPRVAVERAAELLAITAIMDRPVRTLSRGTRQRVGLARAILHEPMVLLLDEPYTGLDEGAAASLAALLDRLHTPERVLVITMHDVARALAGTERLVALSAGRVVLDRSLVDRDEDVADAYLELLHGEMAR
jgi:ABC-type multidrug transport system ATPase subunit